MKTLTDVEVVGVRYELTVVHRVCPVLASTAAIYTDKLELVRVTTLSLARALAGIKTRLVVILDGCGHEYESLFDDVFSARVMENVSYERITTSNIGNFATYAKQVELLGRFSADSTYLYFSEDDYLYRENAIRGMMSFLQTDGVDIVTPLDHPDAYQRDRERVQASVIRVSRDCHWREIASTCCTFMLKASDWKRASRSPSYYAEGGSDFLMGLLLTKKGCFSLSSVIGGACKYLIGKRKNWMLTIPLQAWVKLGLRLVVAPRFRMWSPIPSLAIHLCRPSLPPLYCEIMRGDAVVKSDGCSEGVGL